MTCRSDSPAGREGPPQARLTRAAAGTVATSPGRRWDGGHKPRPPLGRRHQPYRSIAWTISSSRLPTVTARLAKLARLTPRLPRTSLKSFWSVVW